MTFMTLRRSDENAHRLIQRLGQFISLSLFIVMKPARTLSACSDARPLLALPRLLFLLALALLALLALFTSAA
jgi:hypothetical protein